MLYSGRRIPVKKSVAFLLLLSLLFCSCSIETKDKQVNTDNFQNGIYSLSQLRKDFEQFEETIKSKYPIEFTNKDEIYSLLKTQYKMISDNSTEYDFYRIMNPIVQKLHCGYTYLSYSKRFDTSRKNKATYFPLLVKVEYGKIYVTSNPENHNIRGFEIINVNNFTCKDILNILENNIPSDNKSSSFKNYIMSISFNDLYNKFVESTDKFDIRYIDNSGRTHIETFDGLNMESINEMISKEYHLSPDIYTQLEPDMDYAVLTISTFNSDLEKFRKSIDIFFYKLSENKINNLVLDLRGNMGGDPYCSSFLFTYLIDKPLPYFSNEAPGYDNLEKPLQPAANSFNGNLYILIDGGCFSSTTNLCSLLKYHKRGVFIGKETRGSFCYMDDFKQVTLKNTGISFHYPTRIYKTAVSGFDEEKGILPDYTVVPKTPWYYDTDDSMEFACDLIGKNRLKAEGKDKTSQNKVKEVCDINSIIGYDIAYVNKETGLMIRNLKDGSEYLVVDDGTILNYAFNLKAGVVAYAKTETNEFFCNDVYIFNPKTKTKETIDRNAATGGLAWSPSGRYLVVDYGTSPNRGIRIYDYNNKDWIDIPIKNKVSFYGFSWAPKDDILALTIWDDVEPETPIMDGDTLSAGVYFIDKNRCKILMKGTSDYGAYILGWMDNQNLCIEKHCYSDDNSDKKYYSANINNENTKEISKDSVISENLPSNVPKEVLECVNYISPDGKTIVYTFYDKIINRTRIMLWDVEKQTKTEICEGEYPKWITR